MAYSWTQIGGVGFRPGVSQVPFLLIEIMVRKAMPTKMGRPGGSVVKDDAKITI